MYVHVALCCVLCYEFGHWIAYCIAYCPGVDYYCLLAPGVEPLLVSIEYYMLMSTLMLKPLKAATYILSHVSSHFEWLEHECGHEHVIFYGDQ